MTSAIRPWHRQQNKLEMATKTSLPLKVALCLTMVVSAIELSFVSSTVAYLHKNADRTYSVHDSGKIVNVPSLPTTLMTNQGHTSNGAAGTGLIVIGWCGALALWLRGRPLYHQQRSVGGFVARAWYRLWLLLNVPALLLTLGALAYVFAVTNAHAGQRIDLGLVRGTGSGSGGDSYPEGTWTPQGWFEALLALDLASDSDQSGLATIHRVARGWQFNLIPFFLVQLTETILALHGAQVRRKVERHNGQAAARDSSWEKARAQDTAPGLFK